MSADTTLTSVATPKIAKVMTMKRFFGIEGRYKFEYNDLRALITVINVVLVMKFGLSIAWFGLAIAIIGLVKDLATDRKINGLVMHFSSVALNLFFIGQI